MMEFLSLCGQHPGSGCYFSDDICNHAMHCTRVFVVLFIIVMALNTRQNQWFLLLFLLFVFFFHNTVCCFCYSGFENDQK